MVSGCVRTGNRITIATGVLENQAKMLMTSLLSLTVMLHMVAQEIGRAGLLQITHGALSVREVDSVDLE